MQFSLYSEPRSRLPAFYFAMTYGFALPFIFDTWTLDGGFPIGYFGRSR